MEPKQKQRQSIKEVVEKARKLYKAYPISAWQSERSEEEEQLSARNVWSACLRHSWKGETVMESLKFAVDKSDKGVGIFLVEVQTSNYDSSTTTIEIAWSGEKFGASLCEKTKPGTSQKLWALEFAPKKAPDGGAKFNAISISSEDKTKIDEYNKKVSEAAVAKAEAVKIENVKLEYNTSSGWSVSADGCEYRLRKDLSEFRETLRSFRKINKDALEGKLKPYFTNFYDSDLSITDYYTLPYAKLQEICAEASKAVEAEEAKKNAALAAKNAKLAEEISKLTNEEIAERYFTETVSCDECGEFADNAADEVIRKVVWKKSVFEDVRLAADNFVVRSEKGKRYTYKAVNKESVAVFVEKHAAAIEAKRKELIANPPKPAGSRSEVCPHCGTYCYGDCRF